MSADMETLEMGRVVSPLKKLVVATTIVGLMSMVALISVSKNENAMPSRTKEEIAAAKHRCNYEKSDYWVWNATLNQCECGYDCQTYEKQVENILCNRPTIYKSGCINGHLPARCPGPACNERAGE